MPTMAQDLLHGGPHVAAPLAFRPIKPRVDNFVERPWGGARLHAFKGLAADRGDGGRRLGEAFEIAAYDADAEARAHPSMLQLADGTTLSLAALLDRHADTLLGKAFTSRYGRSYPLLPKTLDVKELLSVQGHPEGHTEVYVIIEADPGASIRLGFNQDIEPEPLKQELLAGRQAQRALLERLYDVDPTMLQELCAPWFAEREAGAEALEAGLRPLLARPHLWRDARTLLERLKRVYWRVLDVMNEIEVFPGQVIHNATPARLAAAEGRQPSAEVHALGNPQGREILALEVRRPGPTFRAWDNVRFPVRQVDVGAALEALNLRATRPSDFVVAPTPVAGCAGVLRSVQDAHFRLEHLRPAPGKPVAVPAEPPHSLHALAGAVTLSGSSGEVLGTLRRGESALVPVGVGSYRLETAAAGAEVVKVSLPLDEAS